MVASATALCSMLIQTTNALMLAGGLSREYLLHHKVCPKAIGDDGALIVAAAEHALRGSASDLAYVYQRAVTFETVKQDELERLIERLTTRSERSIELARADVAADDLTTDVRDLANQPPVIRYVNLLVRDAYDAAASDIHLEATRTGLSVRFRVDGVLVPAPEPPAHLHHAVVSRIKLLAELDIAERRRPQDGRIRVRLEARELDLRVSTVPTMFGESVVLRLLDHGGRPVTLSELGMSPTVFQATSRLAGKPHGMLLVTGPTGSGKTTTLYAALQQRDATVEKIITVEDPIEYQLPGITQMPVHRQAGVTFGAALRAILRQDPDVVMIGEMRDKETAEISVQASMTGHLVFSTLHTNDAVSAIPRLLDLGVPDYLVAATLEGVLAQRLVRRICDECRVEYEPNPETVAAVAGRDMRRATLVRGEGCRACRGTGYRGRVGIFELLTVTDALRDAIAARAPRAELRALALEAGFVALREDGWLKVESQHTTVEEVARVVQD
ncbi:MAG TPA: GspE/PulE family protein [Gemmatimonadaceae bacterium]|nr:GspE/PulE family protein [Gemmatimonadaceae bacterium]